MQTVRISYDKARWVVCHCYGINSLKDMWKLVQSGQAILLETGAKLVRTNKQYYLCGYAANGSDVEFYTRVRRNNKTK